METFGERLRRLREAAGFGLNEFAALVERDAGGISRIERGQRWSGKAPSGDDVAIFAHVLGVTTDYLLGRTDDPHGADRRPHFLRSPLTALLRRMGAEAVDDPRRILVSLGIRAFAQEKSCTADRETKDGGNHEVRRRGIDETMRFFPCSPEFLVSSSL
jgi:transcriptional regulator with XRE-family HTH domain